MAGGLKRGSLGSLRHGLRLSEIRSRLGTPIADLPGPENGERVMIYARAGQLRLAGRRFVLGGLDCVLLFKDDRLREGGIVDSRRETMCVCNETSCPDNWLARCEESIAP